MRHCVFRLVRLVDRVVVSFNSLSGELEESDLHANVAFAMKEIVFSQENQTAFAPENKGTELIPMTVGDDSHIDRNAREPRVYNTIFIPLDHLEEARTCNPKTHIFE